MQTLDVHSDRAQGACIAGHRGTGPGGRGSPESGSGSGVWCVAEEMMTDG